MAYFYFNLENISRGRNGVQAKGRYSSVAAAASYINRRYIRDNRNNKRCYTRSKDDLVASGIFLPEKAPHRLLNLQTLIDELDISEIRKDARLAQRIIMSFHIRLTPEECFSALQEFCHENFLKKGRCVNYAIHTGRKDTKREIKLLPPMEERLDNPHAHLIVPLRGLDENGFCKTKLESRISSTPVGLVELRKSWADVQNIALERAGIGDRVSHLSLKEQGIERLPTARINAAAYALERKGIPTKPGQTYIEVLMKNKTNEADKDKMKEILQRRETVSSQLSKTRIEERLMREKQLQKMRNKRDERMEFADLELHRCNEKNYVFERENYYK